MCWRTPFACKKDAMGHYRRTIPAITGDKLLFAFL